MNSQCLVLAGDRHVVPESLSLPLLMPPPPPPPAPVPTTPKENLALLFVLKNVVAPPKPSWFLLASFLQALFLPRAVGLPLLWASASKETSVSSNTVDVMSPELTVTSL